MSKARLTGKRAVWFGLLGTPALLIAAVTLIGVTAGSAGPSTSAAPASQAQAQTGVSSALTALGQGTQTLAQLKAYWTPERMANAKPYPMEHDAAPTKTEGSVESVPALSARLKLMKINADGSVSTGTAEVPTSTQALTEPFHSLIPHTQWQYFAKYLPNSPGGGSNVAASMQHKMFFTQNAIDFVCSSSTIGPDAAWTAGHCVSDGSSTLSTQILHCPSFDNGVNPTAGCWGAAEIWFSNAWHFTGNLDHDFGATDTTDTGTVQAMAIGNFTGVGGGIAWVPVAEGTTAAPNLNWVSFGYPQGAPFNGNKIQACTSSLGYVDAAVAGGQDSVSMGCDMTGGSSGGPWYLSFGLPGQPGVNGSFEACCNFVNGHNSWRHIFGGNDELNSPPFNCLALHLFRAVNDLSAVACP